MLALCQLVGLSVACGPVHKGILVRGELVFEGEKPDHCQLRLYRRRASRPRDITGVERYISTSFVVGGRTAKQFYVVVNCDGRDVYKSDVFSTEEASTDVELGSIEVKD